MIGFILALIGVLLASLGSRDQLIVARFSRVAGSPLDILAVAFAVSLVSAAIAGWASLLIAPILNPKARLFLAALALGFAALEAWLLKSRAEPKEPSRSRGALAIVLLALQLTDAARFLVFGIALAVNHAVAAAAGGAIGGAIALAMAWAEPDRFSGEGLRRVRRGIGGLMLVLAFGIGFRALSPG